MSEAKKEKQNTVYMCVDCMGNCGLTIEKSVCGTVTPSSCELCGRMRYLREFRTGVSAAAIRDDMR